MNIFVAGVHGVGKTHLASRLSSDTGLMHTSASTLIKEERALPEWSLDKRVAEVNENQIALARAVARHNASGRALLLDGHFVLLGEDGLFIPLNVDVFQALNLKAILLIEVPPIVLVGRIAQRDELFRDPVWLADFMATERSHAEAVSGALNVPLKVLESPSDTDFANAVGL